MRSIIVPVLLVMAISAIGGCNRAYHLPGHNEKNLNHPPDITMRVGGRRKAISTGLTLFVLIRAHMSSSDPDVVSVELPDWNTAYLVGKRPGTATVRYYYERRDGSTDPDRANEGFQVEVIP